MSRWETTINTLLGSFLVLTFSLIVAAAFLTLRVTIYLLGLFTTRFLPGLASHQQTTLAAIIAGFLLVEMIKALRWRRWREAFLDFALVSGVIVVTAGELRFGNTPGTFWIPVLLFFGIRPRRSSASEDIGRAQFFLGVTIVSAIFAAEAGLLGTGLLGQVVRESPFVAMLLWLPIVARKGWQQENASPDPNSASTV